MKERLINLEEDHPILDGIIKIICIGLGLVLALIGSAALM